MPDYIVTSPTGQKFRVTAPEGATQEQVLAFAQGQFQSGSLASSAAPPVSNPDSARLSPAELSQLPFFERVKRDLQFGGEMIASAFRPGAAASATPQPQLSPGQLSQLPFWERVKRDLQFSGEKVAPLLPATTAAVGTLIAPEVAIAGRAAPLLGEALSAAAGGGAGTVGQQVVTGQPVDLAAANRAGGIEAIGTLGGGTVVKSLGEIARSIFRMDLDEPAKRAAQFAREQGQTAKLFGRLKEPNAPFPLSSAAPGSTGGTIEQGTRLTLSGDIRTQLDANKVTQFLNNTVGRMTEKGQVFDDAARQGQQFLREVFEPGELAYRKLFTDYAKAVGDKETPVPTSATLVAASEVAENLKRRGTTGELYKKLVRMTKEGAQTLRVRDFDSLHQELTGLRAATNYDDVNTVLAAMTKDMDDFGRTSGVNFADEMARTQALREQFHELRDIPQLERLAAEIGDRNKGGTAGTNDWMNSLFSSGNGKALAKLRELNPTLYHDLADAWLARQIDRAADYTKQGVGRQLNGEKLRTWFEQNQGKIKEIYGSQQARVLDNFSLYAKHMTGAVQRAADKRETFNPVNVSARLAAGGATSYFANPAIVILGEPGAFLLARGLVDPNSALFKAFTEGFSPARRSFMIKSGELAGQAAANRGED